MRRQDMTVLRYCSLFLVRVNIVHNLHEIRTVIQIQTRRTLLFLTFMDPCIVRII